jgi:hypothetical protein
MRVPIRLPLLLLGIAFGSRDAAPDSPASEPCIEIAGYLSDFSARHPELTIDTGRAEFLATAIDLSFERVKSKRLAVEVLHPTEHDNALNAVHSLGVPVADPRLEQLLQTRELGGRHLYDARSLGGLVILSDDQGTMHCSSGFLMKSEKDGLHLGPILENEGGQICWDSTFEVIKVGESAFPAVVTRDVYFRSLTYKIALLPTNSSAMNVNSPLCTVSVSYAPTFTVAEWFEAPDLGAEAREQIKSQLEPILTNLAAGTYIQPSSDTSGIILSDDFLRQYERHGLSTSDLVPFARSSGSPYTELAAARSPIEIDGKHYVLGYGDALFGWRTWMDSAFGVWAKNGSDLSPVLGGFMGKHGTNPKISVEAGKP